MSAIFAFVSLFALTVPSTLALKAQEQLGPYEWWTRGILLVRAADEEERNGNFLAALNQLGEAEPIFIHLSQNFPEFQSEIVSERRRIIAAKREELKQQMNPRTAGAASPSIAGMAGPSGPSPRAFDPPPAGSHGSQVGHSQAGAPAQGARPPIPSYGSEQRVLQVEPTDHEFTLPSWEEGASQSLPRVSGGIDGIPRVETRQPSVGAVASALHSDLANKDQLINWLNQENQRLRQQVAERDAMMARAQEELSFARANYDELVRQQTVAMAGGGPERVEELKSLVRNATEQLQEALDANDRLVSELGESRDEVKKLQSRIGELERDRDNLAEIVRGEGHGGKALKELMERNRTLTEQLDRAERLAISLSELNKEKDEDIAMLKSEINRVRLERDQLLAENARHQQSIDELQRKLEQLSDGIDSEERVGLASASPTVQQENEMLRSWVLTQLRRQAQMKQAKELLIRQLGRVGERSDVLLSLVDDITRGTQISPEMRSLFRAPQIQELIEAATGESPVQSLDLAMASSESFEDGESTDLEMESDSVDPINSVEGAEGGAGGTKPIRAAASMSATLVAAGAAPPSDDAVIPNKRLSVELVQIDKAARLDFLEGRYSEAEVGYLEYLRLRPRSVPCLCNLGVLKIAMASYSEAEYFLERALAIDEESGLAHYLLGRTYYLQGRLDEALERLETGLSHDPQNARAHNCIGVISSQKGWVGRAESAFTSAVSIDPRYGDAHFNLAVLYTTREDPNPKAAEKHYREAIQLGLPRDAFIEDYLETAATEGAAIGMR